MNNVIPCPSCSFPIPNGGGEETALVVCPQCEASVVRTTMGWQMGESIPVEFRSILPLTIGQEGHLRGELYRILGWGFYGGYADGRDYHWEEWWMVSESGDYRFMSYSPDEGFLLLKEIPSHITRPPQVGQTISTPSGNAKVVDEIRGELIDFVGELPWKASLGEASDYYTAMQDDLYFSVECGRGEMALFGGYPLEEEEVENAFGFEHRVPIWHRVKRFFGR